MGVRQAASLSHLGRAREISHTRDVRRVNTIRVLTQGLENAGGTTENWYVGGRGPSITPSFVALDGTEIRSLFSPISFDTALAL